jgi:8-oxo-dGTP diphosphatase
MDKTYCMKCGHELSPKLIDGRDRLVCNSCGHIQFENPKVSAGVLIEREGQVLLAKRASDPFAGHWYLPSGYVEVDETTEEAAKREAREEIGVDVVVQELFTALSYNDDPRGNGVIVIYLASIYSGEPQPGDDVSDVKFFRADSLPEKIAFGHHRTILDKWLEYRESPIRKERNLRDLNHVSEDYRYRDELMIQEFSIGTTGIFVLLTLIISPDRHNFLTGDVLVLLLMGCVLLYLLTMHLSRINVDRVKTKKLMQRLEDELHLQRVRETSSDRKGSVPTLMVRFFVLLNVAFTVAISVWLYFWFRLFI